MGNKEQSFGNIVFFVCFLCFFLVTFSKPYTILVSCSTSTLITVIVFCFFAILWVSVCSVLVCITHPTLPWPSFVCVCAYNEMEKGERERERERERHL